MVHDQRNSSREVPGSYKERFIFFIWYEVIFGMLTVVRAFLLEVFHSMKPFDYDALPKHSGQTVVLTGGTRGIGLKVLKKLMQLDFFVILGVRNIDAGLKAIKQIRLEGVKTGTAKCLNLDLKSLSSVRKFSQNVLKEVEYIDLLINNAGVMLEPYDLTEDGFEVQFQVNHLSHFLLTQILLPKMIKTAARKSTNCRVVNVSSVGHFGASAENIKDLPNPKVYNPTKAYFDSKLCQVLFTKYQDAELKSEGANVKIYALHPGMIITDLYANLPFQAVVKWLKGFFRSEDTGAEVVIYTAISPDLEGKGGLYIANKRICQPSRVTKDLNLQKSLWDLSQKCVLGRRLLSD